MTWPMFSIISQKRNCGSPQLSERRIDIYTESIYLSRARSQIETRAFFEKRLAERTKLLEKKAQTRRAKSGERNFFFYLSLGQFHLQASFFVRGWKKSFDPYVYFPQGCPICYAITTGHIRLDGKKIGAYKSRASLAYFARTQFSAWPFSLEF